MRSRSTFVKLQKERARQQKQREKMERRQQRKAERAVTVTLEPGAPAERKETP
jgi:hypothetical protein